MNKIKYNFFFNQIRNIKLPRIRSDCIAKYFTIEEIDKDKFTNLEKLIHTSNLLYEIDKKIKEIEENDGDLV